MIKGIVYVLFGWKQITQRFFYLPLTAAAAITTITTSLRFPSPQLRYTYTKWMAKLDLNWKQCMRFDCAHNWNWITSIMIISYHRLAFLFIHFVRKTRDIHSPTSPPPAFFCHSLSFSLSFLSLSPRFVFRFSKLSKFIRFIVFAISQAKIVIENWKRNCTYECRTHRTTTTTAKKKSHHIEMWFWMNVVIITRCSYGCQYFLFLFCCCCWN